MHQRPAQVVFLYGTKAGTSPIEAEKILFLPRLQELLRDAGPSLDLQLYLTDVSEQGISQAGSLPARTVPRRIAEADLEASLGEADTREATVCYVCGPQVMTDKFVAFLASCKGMAADRVLCEKWW